MSSTLELMGPNGVNVAAELAMPWCKRGRSCGDYLEFGTYRARSFIASMRAAESAFAAGNYACSLDDFRSILRTNDVDMSRVTLVPGFYRDSLTESLKSELSIETGIVNIDCDIYESTVDVLSFITGFVRTGTLLFTEYFKYRCTGTAFMVSILKPHHQGRR